MVKITSAAAATARGVSAQTAPRASSGSARVRVRVKTVARWPAAIRWPHIEAPMMPVPIQPMRGASTRAVYSTSITNNQAG